MNPKRVFLYIFIASVSLSALIGIGVVLFGNFGDLELRVLVTTLTVTITSILGLACGAYLERKKVPLPLAGIVFAIVSALLWLFVIWQHDSPNEAYLKITTTLTILAYSCSHLSLLSLARLETRFAWVLLVAHFLIWSIAGLAIFVVLTEARDYDLISRTMGVLAILIAAVTIVTPVLHKLSTVQPNEEIDAEISRLRLRIQELEAKKAHTVESKIAE